MKLGFAMAAAMARFWYARVLNARASTTAML